MASLLEFIAYYHVKEEMITLIDTWQEAFGGVRARYSQYFAAYMELLVLFYTYQTYCIILFISHF